MTQQQMANREFSCQAPQNDLGKSYGFEFDGYEDGWHQPNDLLALYYGYPEHTLYFDSPPGYDGLEPRTVVDGLRAELLYVKWRVRATGEIHEEHVDLKSRLAGIRHYDLRMAIKNGRVYVYDLIVDKIRGQKYYKYCELYPENTISPSPGNAGEDNLDSEDMAAVQAYREGVQRYRQSAQQGDASAQFSLGVLYRDGLGTPRDFDQAMQWFRAAARQGNSDAALALGNLYSQGWGVALDYAQSAQWWRVAAEQGNADAQYDLGLSYDRGQGVPQDYSQAAQWYRKAARQGKALAQYHLGELYVQGLGVVQDYGQAAQWYRKAAEQGNALALRSLGMLYTQGQGVPMSKVVAYALLDLSWGQDLNGKITSQNILALRKEMTEQEIEAGKVLSQKMTHFGEDLRKALDEYGTAPGG